VSYLNSPDYYLEQAIADLFSGISGVNVYTTTRIGAKLFPYISISAKPVRQMCDPYSGVFEMDVSVNYSDTSAKISANNFDSKYLDIFASLYSSGQSLLSRIQDQAGDIHVYMARISSQTPTILLQKTSWVRGLTISTIITPKQNAAGLRYLDFSNYLNSQYLALV
jgi:hypothetical protein